MLNVPQRGLYLRKNRERGGISRVEFRRACGVGKGRRPVATSKSNACPYDDGVDIVGVEFDRRRGKTQGRLGVAKCPGVPSRQRQNSRIGGSVAK